jgi:hypothetical protein
MNTNLAQIVQTDDTLTGLFLLQFMDYKRHFESMVRYFYPNKDIMPKGNFKALEFIETYFPDIASQYNKHMEHTTFTPTTTEGVVEKKQPALKKTKKAPLVTEMEAEKILLEQVFNLNFRKLN